MKRGFFIALSLIAVISLIVPASLTFAKTKKPLVPATPTTAELLQKYTDAAAGKDKVRILIVPGHEPDFGGAVYQGVYEREITVETADQLATYLRQNPRFDVIVARSNTSWTDDLDDYFDDEWDDIGDFVSESKEAFQKLVDKGELTQRTEDDQVSHAAAPNDVALRLYGINRWANENDIDLVVHLHVNDAPDHGPNDPSPNSGFTVYVPDEQYGNAAASLPVGAAIAARLSTLHATSTLAIESKGVVEDQELIALGAYDTLAVPSVLMEYAYITEPRFQHPEVRNVVTKDYAFETYEGIQDFFKDPVIAKFPSASLPFTFATSSVTAASTSPAIYALQSALHSMGFYPPYASTTAATTTAVAAGMPVLATTTVPSVTMPLSLTTCPIDGVLNGCIPEAIMAFQKSRGFAMTGALGPMTTAALNAYMNGTPISVVSPAVPMTPVIPASTSTTQTASASSTVCAVPTQSLVQNDTDAMKSGDVSRLQKVLSATAYYPEKLVTGVFGPATLAAVQKFQVAKGIAAAGGPGYGLVGPKTITALQGVCN